MHRSAINCDASSHRQLITLSKKIHWKSPRIRSFLWDRTLARPEPLHPLGSSLENIFPFSIRNRSNPSFSDPIAEFFNDTILSAVHSGLASFAPRNESMENGASGAGLTNEFRRGSVPAPLHFEVLSPVGNQPAWQMFAETSTSLSFFLRFFRGQTRSTSPPPS